MEAPNTFSELFGLVRSWFTWRSDPDNVSRDFWMPDESCRVCYECDSQFSVIIRKHHCRHCGRVFCAKCTRNTVPFPRSAEDRVRVCNYCFKQWEKQQQSNDNGDDIGDDDFEFATTSPSAGTSFSTPNSVANAPPPSESISKSSDLNSDMSRVMEQSADSQGLIYLSGTSNNDITLDRAAPSQEQFSCRSDDDDDEDIDYQSDTETKRYKGNNNYNNRDFEPKNATSSNDVHSDSRYKVEDKKEDERHTGGDEGEASSSIYAAENINVNNVETVDFENNGLIWLPPEPEDEDDEKEAMFMDEADENDGEWGSMNTSSSGEYRNRDCTTEEQQNLMKNVVYGHFRALIAQLLQVENLPMNEEGSDESWLDIISSLSWEAASLLKPDTSRSGGMDPGGYVKIKCLASGRRSESMLVKGVVCKKNVAHRRMTSRIDKPRILILGGALEYQRVSNLLSSFDTLLQQEMDHLKMAVAKIDAHQPDVLLVENSVSRYAQDYLLEKDISLVLNIKRPLLDRIARCTGAEKVPSVDHLSADKVGYCEKFHVERFQEDHGSAGQGGKKLMKTLMFFEGCPRPQAFTILLRGASGDELKKLKHVAQYGLFAAYHLGLETSFLADERASLPELPLKSPINVALPDKSIERSISMVPGFGTPVPEKSRDTERTEPLRSNSVPIPTDILPPDFCNCPTESHSTTISSSTYQVAMDSWNNGAHSFDTTKTRNETSYEETSYVSADNCGSYNSSVANGFAPPSKGDDDVTVTQQSVECSTTTLQGENKNNFDETGALKEEFSSEHQSILVSLSSRCVWKGTVCERSHLFRIKYYGSFDKPLGRFLRDHLFDQNYQCNSCNKPSEAHVHCYTHRQGTLTISVRKLEDFFLPGEAEGKIWMWHRCLQCPRANGFPPATRRVVMSDAAWGLSFGKFLELSFSNHAAASRVASCGHSLHRDCLRFYGFSNMVACFRYASIDVLSVYLPPATLDIRYDNQSWIQKEADEVVKRAETLFSEVLNALTQISKKKYGTNPRESSGEIANLEGILQREKTEFDEALQKTMNKEVRKGHFGIDILEINRLRRQLLFQSIMWDHRLVGASESDTTVVSNPTKLAAQEMEKPCNEVAVAPPKAEITVTGLSSDPVDGKFGQISNLKPIQTKQSDLDAKSEDSQSKLSASAGVHEHGGRVERGSSMRRSLSDGQIPNLANLSESLDAAWTGEIDTGPKSGPEKEGRQEHSNELLDKQATVDEQHHSHGIKPKHSVSAVSSPKAPAHQAEDQVSWFKLPFLSFYRSVNKNVLSSAQKLDDLLYTYKPVYITSYREADLLCGARLLLPVGVNDTVIPVYDDEPTSIISYALASYEYSFQISDTEKLKDAEPFSSSFFSDSSHLTQSMHSLDDFGSESTRNLGSTIDEGSLARSSSGLDLLPHTKDFHAKVSFSDEAPNRKVRYSVTCYFARRFEALRRICCPSEMDYIRCLTRCKKWGAQGGKSNVFFAKTLDDRFIIKQVTKTELESFFKFAPAYFKYLSESIDSGSPTCLAKIFGIYQVISKHVKGGRESKMDVLVMENLLYKRNVIRLYDLKGSSRSRYNPDSSGSNKVLLDQNLIEAMPTSPIFVGNKAKRLLGRAVWNDTSFLASVDVMDYSLLVGVDGEKHELVLGIIDFMRQYTWDKHLETWVKASGLLGGPKNASPTIISPKQYKKRFRKAMTAYFLMVPDQWSPPALNPSKSQTDLNEAETNPRNEPVQCP